VAPQILCAANQMIVTNCDSAVRFAAPTATDNCDGNPSIVCTPASGTLLGPGAHTITATATDFSGNVSTCTFTVTVLTPLRVVFASPLEDDNIANNSTLDGADAAGTAEIVNYFNSGSRIPHKVKLLNCSGADVTDTIASLVKVTIEVTQRTGTYLQATTATVLPANYTGTGDAGNRMVLVDHHFQYNLNTTGYLSDTDNDGKGGESDKYYFQSLVRVEYLANPGIVVGLENVIMESK